MKVKLGKYKHYKGKFYEVLGVAYHSETMEELVVYRGLNHKPKLLTSRCIDVLKSTRHSGESATPESADPGQARMTNNVSYTGPNALWVRPKKMFLEKVKVNGKLLPRFRFISRERKPWPSGQG